MRETGPERHTMSVIKTQAIKLETTHSLTQNYKNERMQLSLN